MLSRVMHWPAFVIEEEPAVREAGEVRLCGAEVPRPAIAVDERGEAACAAAPYDNLYRREEWAEGVGQQGRADAHH